MVKKVVTSMFNKYVDFFANFNVLGLAIGLMIGSNLKEVAGDFIDGIIMPFIKPILGTITGGRDLKFKIPGTEVELDLDKVTASSIKFGALSVIIFVMLQLGVQIKKPVQWVSVRNWDKMKKNKNVKLTSTNSRTSKSNKGFTL
uniref:Large conductance mechanosensitive channel protein n=1 Tax=viral metagenome TaxID=1070528 RepID=A0A6C0KCF0_9ZZZZ